MTYGIIVNDANGNNIINSEKGGFLLLDVITLDAGTSTGSRSYPDLVGYTLHTQQVYGSSVGGLTSPMHSVTVTYSDVPAVTWTYLANAVGTALYIFVT